MCVSSRHLSMRLHSTVMEAVVVVLVAAWACLVPVLAQSTVPQGFILRAEHLLARDTADLLRSGASAPAPCTTPDGVNGVCGSVYNCETYSSLLDHLHNPEVLDFFRTRVCNVTPKFVHLCCPSGATPTTERQSSSLFFFDTTPAPGSPSGTLPTPSQRPNGRQPSVPRSGDSDDEAQRNPLPQRPTPRPALPPSERTPAISIGFPQSSPVTTTTHASPSGAFGGPNRQPPAPAPFTTTTPRAPQNNNQPPTEPPKPPILPAEGECGTMAQGTTRISPWAVGIGVLDKRNFNVNCTGTLVSRLHVITAAHCVERAAPTYVRLGNPQLREQSLDVPVLDWITPNFDPSTRENDLALITLTKPITFTDNIKPVCLPFRYRLDGFRDQELNVVGWGGTATLENGAVSVLGSRECRAAYTAPSFIANNNVGSFASSSASSFAAAASPRASLSVTVDRRNLCASPAPTGSSSLSCLSQFGAPLIYHDVDTTGLHYLAGVASLGDGCQAGPGLYTRLGAFLPWLSRQLSRVEVPAARPAAAPTPPRRIQAVGINFG